MANEVYANGREIACKAASGKTTAAFPDTCLSPPSPPAGPVPVPYPNTAYASDTTNGSTTVMISGQEVMLKDRSTFKKSTGDEAATKSLGMGVITHTIQGEASFVAWSMDVKIEGQNADRHLDMTVDNEQCDPASTPPWPYVDQSAFKEGGKCDGDRQAMNDACGTEPPCPGNLGKAKRDQLKEHGSMEAAANAAGADVDGNKCVEKSRCYLRPYRPGVEKDGCCKGQTGHHIPPKACFKDLDTGKYRGSYTPSSALCVCMEGMNQHCGSHGKNHAAIEWLAKEKGMALESECSVADYNKLCAETLHAQCGCNKDCILEQLNGQENNNSAGKVNHITTNSSSGVTTDLENRIRATANLPSGTTSG